MKIKDLHKTDQPREKLAKYGPDKLSDKEILAVILRTGIKGKNVLELSKEVLAKIEKAGLENTTADILLGIKGLGQTKALQIIASLELGRRLLKGKQTKLILSPKDVWNQLADIRESRKEHFVVFFLDTRNQVIRREIISIGTLDASLVHPREVFEPAIRHNAAQIIIAHNHPSGSTEPSDEDLAVTKRLKEAGKLLGISVLEHIIITKDSYYSLKNKDILE